MTTPTTTHVTALQLLARTNTWRLRACCAVLSFCSYWLTRHCNNIQPVRGVRHHELIKERNDRNNGICTWFCDDTRLCDINAVRSKLSCSDIIQNFRHDCNYIFHDVSHFLTARFPPFVSENHCRIRVRRTGPFGRYEAFDPYSPTRLTS